MRHPTSFAGRHNGLEWFLVASVQWLLQEKARRQELYQQFIEEASKLYVDALIHDQAEIPPLVSIYASINKIRVVSNPGVAERADKVVRIIERRAGPLACRRWVLGVVPRRRAAISSGRWAAAWGTPSLAGAFSGD
jgi:hypothetical protein